MRRGQAISAGAQPAKRVAKKLRRVAQRQFRRRKKNPQPVAKSAGLPEVNSTDIGSKLDPTLRWSAKITRTSQPYPTGSFLLLAAAVLPYILMLALIWDGPSWGDTGGEARHSEAWAQFFAVASGILLWLALGGLVLLAGRRGHVPQTWRIVAGALYLLAALATVGAAQSYFSWPGGWSILVPALLPPLLALYGVCARLPVLASGPLRLVPAVALGAVALVAFTAIPFAFIDPVGYSDRLVEHKRRIDAEFDRIAAQHQESARQWEADINKLRPESPLAAWLEYVNGSTASEPLHQQAIDGARRVNHRQADAIGLLDQGQIRRLAEMWQLDIDSTPALCAAYNQSFHRLAASDEVYELKVGEDLERQLPNLRFLVAAKCDLDAGLSAAEARVRKLLVIYPDGDGHARWIKFQADLGALHRK